MGIKGYRYVGRLLGKNPEPDKYPCYKVVQSNGKLGGFALGNTNKIQRLKADGIEVSDGKVVEFRKIKHQFIP